MERTSEKGCRLIHVLPVGFLISLLLQFVGLVTPGWFCFEIAGSKVQIGLYYVVICVQGQCLSRGVSELSEFNKDSNENFMAWFSEYRVMAAIGVAAAALATFLTMLYTCQSRVRRFPNNFQGCLALAILAGIVSGALAVASARKLGDQIISTKNILNEINADIMVFNFPYSLFLTGIGGLVSLFTAFVTIGYLVSETKAKNSSEVATPGLVIQQYGGFPPTTQIMNPNAGFHQTTQYMQQNDGYSPSKQKMQEETALPQVTQDRNTNVPIYNIYDNAHMR